MSRYFSWSGPFHYVDTGDNPPYSCGFVDERDCPNGSIKTLILGKCLVGAITNYTDQLTCKYDSVVKRTQEHHQDNYQGHHHVNYQENDSHFYNETGRSIALKFLVHFMGDSVQPLHLCSRGLSI